MMVEYQGVTKPLRTWAAELGLGYRTLWSRLKRGIPLDRAMQSGHIEKRKPARQSRENDDEGVCNLTKSAKHPIDYMQSRGFLL